MYKHMNEVPESLAAEKQSPESKQLAHLIARCLEKKPEDRPQISEVAAEINRIFSADLDEIDLFTNRVKGNNYKNRLKLAGGLVAILVLAVGTGFGLHSLSDLKNIQK